MKKQREKKPTSKNERLRILRRMRRLVLQRGLVVLLILVQFALWLWLLISGANLVRGISQALHILAILLAFYVISRREPGAYKLLWVTLLLMFPILGLVLYVLLRVQARTNLKAKYLRDYEKSTEPFLHLPEAGEARILQSDDDRSLVLLSAAGYPIYGDTALSYCPSGEDKLRLLLEELKQAKRYIFLEYFIIDAGEMWDRILAVLLERREAGVEIRIMMDDIGCFLLRPRHYAKELERLGFQVRVFNHLNPFISSAQNYRDHRKIISIDGISAFTGGLNLGDEYINKKSRFGYWKDTAVMMRGAAAWSMTVMFLRMWDLNMRKTEDFTPYLPTALPEGGCGMAAPYASSPIGNPLARKLYLSMFGAARRRLYITTPYLILDDAFTDALRLSATSGVDVRIIVPGVPDKKFVNMVTKSYYRPLMEAGVRIYEYTPGFVHAKMVLSDDSASVGSANMDYRSLYLSFEAGVYMKKTPVVEEIADDIAAMIEKSKELTEADLRGHYVTKLITLFLKLFEPLL